MKPTTFHSVLGLCDPLGRAPSLAIIRASVLAHKDCVAAPGRAAELVAAGSNVKASAFHADAQPARLEWVEHRQQPHPGRLGHEADLAVDDSEGGRRRFGSATRVPSGPASIAVSRSTSRASATVLNSDNGGSFAFARAFEHGERFWVRLGGLAERFKHPALSLRSLKMRLELLGRCAVL